MTSRSPRSPCGGASPTSVGSPGRTPRASASTRATRCTPDPTPHYASRVRRPRPWVIVPGIWNSDPDHWQSLWQDDRSADDPGAVVRIAPASWSEPDPDDWS
ncbi:alpha/beta hydrolase, partial [Curtobacterium sp. MCBA15_016]|uniref:alpha/beta hydrolase n=1 Tax=Curtobacterium sp. MCBA15_016 TaxID=1898740 RepID=UPI0034A39D9F